MSCSGWSAVNPVCQVKDALGGVASDAASGVFSTIAAWVGLAMNPREMRSLAE